jgi:hypothetical protein
MVIPGKNRSAPPGARRTTSLACPDPARPGAGHEDDVLTGAIPGEGGTVSAADS